MSLGRPTARADDPSAAASKNAALAWASPVTSAGNSADSYYVSGTPPSAVRASRPPRRLTLPIGPTDQREFAGPFAGLYIGSQSVNFNWTTPARADGLRLLSGHEPVGCAA